MQTATRPPQTGQPTYEMTADDTSRMKRISNALAAYDGDFPEPLLPMDDEANDNVMPNRVAGIVNTGGDFLFGDELGIAVEEEAPDAAQKLIDATWGIKEARIPLLQELHMNGAFAGRAFLRIVPSKNRSGRPQTFRLVPIDPATVCVSTAPQDCETVLLYCLQYSTTEKQDGKDETVYYREELQRIDPDGNALRDQPDDDDTWSIQHWSQVGSVGMQPRTTGWIPAGQPIVWPYPFPPIFSCKNMPRPNSFWGTPDATKSLIRQNNALNLDLSNANRDGKINASPIIWAKGMGGATLDIKPGQATIIPPTPESEIGAVKIESDIPSLLSLAADIRSDMDEESSTPGVATGRITAMPRGNLSGVALELLFMPLLKKTNVKRCLYGKLIIDVCQALFVLAKLSNKLNITLGWISPIPHDDLAAVQAAISKLELDISKTTLQRELNYDPKEEAKLLKAEEEQAQKKQAASDSSTIAALPPEIPGTPPIPGQTPGIPGQSDSAAVTPPTPGEQKA
jgi:hypothetical protein